MRFSVLGILSRHQSLQFSELSVDVYVHPESDPGCLRRAHDFLRPLHRQYSHAVVMFDREGCGRGNESREVLEEEVEQRLAATGWANRAAVVVIDPELEIWVWSDSPEVDSTLGWPGARQRLAHWLIAQGYRREGEAKPIRPKEAFEEALRIARKRRSSIIYRQLAERVSLHRCADPAFAKLTKSLRNWFGETSGEVPPWKR
jgi:hypothetical protein